MQNAGTNVIINVSSRALDLVNAETGQRIASHNMPHISFASGGDSVRNRFHTILIYSQFECFQRAHTVFAITVFVVAICVCYSQDTLDFLAYIAKNEDEWRACYVLECIGGQSEDLILTIGKAFMLRFNAIKHLK